MDLARNIRNDRARQRQKQSREYRVFQVLGCIVKAYGLKRDFLVSLESAGGQFAGRTGQALRVRAKSTLEVPPFVLVSWDEYGLVLEIMARVDNPYLPWARSPQEILLSKPLYERNPSLEAKELQCRDFDLLLTVEEARAELEELERSGRMFSEERGDGGGWRFSGAEGLFAPSSQDRIQQLRAFLAKLGHTGSQAE